ncbi:hypothetical protein [Streptomyces lasiicapitis]|uniref:hypothetical protein n=1 Tax=Streptomyces lasiicapitis TaxID=1923961 RepID=UPI003647FCDE
MSGQEFPSGRPGREPRLRSGFPAEDGIPAEAAAARAAAGLNGAPCLLMALLCLILALGPAANVFPGDMGQQGEHTAATEPFGPPVDALEGRSEAGSTSGCNGGGERETPREAVIPVPEQQGVPAQRAASPRHDPSRGLALLAGTSSPDATAVDLYQTRVIRT